jgi:hypothetical protein
MDDTTDYDELLGLDEPLTPEQAEWQASDSEKGFFWGDTSEFDYASLH